MTFKDAGGSTTSTTTGLPFAWLPLSDTTSLDTIAGPAAGLTINGGGLGLVLQIGQGARHVHLRTDDHRHQTSTDTFRRLTTGALTIDPTAELTLNQCTISGNTGIGVSDLGGPATLTNCTISNNTGLIAIPLNTAQVTAICYLGVC